MLLSAASALYAAAAVQRRAWYTHHPARRRRLRHPVVSVGSLRVGGSGKTPVVGHVAALLLAAGERPAILSRGYARELPCDGVTVVSDGEHVLADVRTAGDEPLMLARAYPCVPVLVCADRYLAGRLAEEQLKATVHVLDDGFQHLALSRDVDLLLADRADLADRVLPRGRLREPLGAAALADALLTTEDDEAALAQLRTALGLSTMFRVRRHIGPVTMTATGLAVAPSAADRAVAFAGVARPERFFADLRLAGWELSATIAFPDHHRFTAADMTRVGHELRRAGATFAITTAKDAVRWPVSAVIDVPLAVAALTAEVEPSTFSAWLLDRLHAARARGRRSADTP